MVRTIVAVPMELLRLSGLGCQYWLNENKRAQGEVIRNPRSNFSQELINVFGFSYMVSCFSGLLGNSFPWKMRSVKLKSSFMRPGYGHKKMGIEVVSPNISSPTPSIGGVECLEAWDDEYDGVIIDSNSLPLSANAFSSALKASLSIWKLKVIYFLSCFRLAYSHAVNNMLLAKLYLN